MNTPSVTDFKQFAAMRSAADQKDPAALKKAAQQFEAMFTQMLLKTSRETSFGDDLTGKGGDFYKDMYDQQLALHLASSGKGLGLATMLINQLGGKAAAASPAGASAAQAAAARQFQNTADAAQTDTGSNASAQDASDFVAAIQPHAEKAAAELGVPARALIAQAALETGWGRHMATQADGSGVNLFNIKATGSWSGSASAPTDTSEYSDGKWSSEQAQFRTYGSIADSFDGYVKFLKSNPRYTQALRSGDVSGFANALQKAGYATDPHYAQKLVRVAYGSTLNGALGATTVRA